MKKISEKVFVGVVSNVVIFVMLVALVFSGVLANKKSLVLAGNSEYRGTIYAGDKSSKKISLMINVYWGTEYVVQMLDILKQNSIKTTFFVGGTWVEENPEILIRMKDDGHEIGSHGYNHKEHGKLSYDQNHKEIKMCHDIVKLKSNISMELFAPPGGSYNKYTTDAAFDLGYKTIMWTRDTIDWRDHDTNLIFSRATSSMNGGDLILMHPTKNTVEALQKIIDFAKQKGLEPSTVSQTLGLV